MLKLRNDLESLEFWWRTLSRVRPLWPWIGRWIEDVRLLRKRGRLAGNATVRTAIRRELQPLDILLERSSFHLADYVIPGHFHHAGVYLGGAGAGWPDAARHLASPPDATADEGTVIEATHEGVRLVSLSSFLDVDTLLVLRDRRLKARDPERLRAAALRELGKAYDYYFDLEDPRHQFCTKLVATIFAHFDFRSPLVAGTTLVPDHLVATALRDPAQELVPVLLADGVDGLVRDGLPEALAQRIGAGAAAVRAPRRARRQAVSVSASAEPR
jgi:hypothetical protein